MVASQNIYEKINDLSEQYTQICNQNINAAKTLISNQYLVSKKRDLFLVPLNKLFEQHNIMTNLYKSISNTTRQNYEKTQIDLQQRILKESLHVAVSELAVKQREVVRDYLEKWKAAYKTFKLEVAEYLNKIKLEKKRVEGLINKNALQKEKALQRTIEKIEKKAKLEEQKPSHKEVIFQAPIASEHQKPAVTEPKPQVKKAPGIFEKDPQNFSSMHKRIGQWIVNPEKAFAHEGYSEKRDDFDWVVFAHTLPTQILNLLATCGRKYPWESKYDKKCSVYYLPAIITYYGKKMIAVISACVNSQGVLYHYSLSKHPKELYVENFLQSIREHQFPSLGTPIHKKPVSIETSEALKISKTGTTYLFTLKNNTNIEVICPENFSH